MHPAPHQGGSRGGNQLARSSRELANLALMQLQPGAMIRLVAPVQNMTDCLSREAITVLDPASNARAYKQIAKACDPGCGRASMRMALTSSKWCWRPPASEVSSRALRFTVLQPVQVEHQPAVLGKFIGWIQLASRVPERLAGMVPGEFRFAIF